MPKAILIRKPNNTKDEHTGNRDESKIVDLLDFSSCSPVDGDGVGSSRDKPLQGQQTLEEKRKGACGVQKDVRGDTENPEENRNKHTGERGGAEKDVHVCAEQDSPADGKEHGRTGTAETPERGKRKVRERKKVVDGTRSAIEKGKRNLESKGRGAEKEGKEQEGVREEGKRPQDFERKEFPESDRIAPYRQVVHGPYPTDEMFCVDIVLNDGYLYRVSECSVKDGKYIQGLDSRFLISRFHPHIKKTTP